MQVIDNLTFRVWKRISCMQDRILQRATMQKLENQAENIFI